MKLSITTDDRELKQTLSQLKKRAGDLTPVMRDIGEIVHRSVRKNFKEGGRPDKWAESKRAEAEGGQTLIDKGRLKNSITVEAGKDSVLIGTNVGYAAVHHFGFKGSVSIPAHSRKTKKGKASVKAHSRKLKIAARPFMLVQDSDWKKIDKAAVRHLTEG